MISFSSRWIVRFLCMDAFFPSCSSEGSRCVSVVTECCFVLAFAIFMGVPFHSCISGRYLVALGVPFHSCQYTRKTPSTCFDK